jgi:hypothetical protein
MTQNSVLGEQYVSARATPKLVGHLKARDKIHKAIRDDTRSYLVYIYGPGGIGKTWLIRDILENPPKSKKILCAKQLIDLYHIRNNSVSGIIASIFKAFPGFEIFFRRKLKTQFAEKAELEREGLSLSEVVVQGNLIDFFLATINEFRSGKRLVIAIDTAEKLLLARDPIQERLRLQKQIPWVIRWLVNNFIPVLKDTVVILAGRPEKNNFLRKEFQKIKGKNFLPLELHSLNMEEAMNYFEAVVDETRKEGLASMQPLSSINKQERRDILSRLGAGGAKSGRAQAEIRPIMISLAIDYLVTHSCSVDELIKVLDGTGDSANELESNLISSFINGKRPVDDLILAMALAPKGIDGSLLRHLHDQGFVTAENVDDLLVALKSLSFVKFRLDDKRVFLHDEVQSMIQNRVWKYKRLHAENVKRSIADYYYNRIEEDRRRIMHDQLDPRTRSDTRWRLVESQVEYLHYLLALGAPDVMDVYARYAEQALLSNDEGLDLQLRAELLTRLEKNMR